MPRSKNDAVFRVIGDEQRRANLRRAKTDLYWLGCQLGYEWNPKLQQGLTPEYHGDTAAWLAQHEDEQAVAIFKQRGGLKTTLFVIAYHVQQILKNPDITGLVLHAVEEQAIKTAEEVAELFFSNTFLRSLDPIGVYPEGFKRKGKDLGGKAYNVCAHFNTNRKNWSSDKKGFKITTRPGLNPTTRRQPTLVGKGLGGEATGIHVDVIYADDIIGEKTLEDATGMAKARSTWATTVENVLNPMGKIRAVGTRYDEQDIYDDWIRSKGWKCLIRHQLEGPDGEIVHEPGKPFPYGGEPTHYGPGYSENGKVIVPGGKKAAMDRTRKKFFRMNSPAIFAAQCMNDPSPTSERPWSKEYEHFIGLEAKGDLPGAKGPGVVLVLSDPAPHHAGSTKSIGEKERKDGSKDYWAVAVVKWRSRGERQELILLDGAASQTWKHEEGADVIANFMHQYSTNKFLTESPDEWYQYVKDACNRAATSPPMKEANGQALRYRDYNKANGKNNRFTALSSLAEAKMFLISAESCRDDFLYGDNRYTGFLTQARGLRPMPGNRNNLRFDDYVDVVSRATDARCREFAPRPDFSSGISPASPFRSNQPQRAVRRWGTRHIRP